MVLAALGATQLNARRNASRWTDKAAGHAHENLGSLSMLEIKDAVLDDLDAITATFVQCFNGPPWNDGWSTAAASERLAGILEARHFRGAVAVLRWKGSRANPRTEGTLGRCLPFEMCVLPERQRSGVGGALLRHVTARLRGEGTEKVYLITGPDSGAAAFYSVHGYYASRGRIVMALSIKSC